jgi:sodium/hydrogen exchanger-like protein 6/7
MGRRLPARKSHQLSEQIQEPTHRRPRRRRGTSLLTPSNDVLGGPPGRRRCRPRRWSLRPQRRHPPLTVIIFGGTTARMLEILGIRTGVVEEIDSDDEFDIEAINGGTYSRSKGLGFGHTPRPSQNGLALSSVDGREGAYSSSSGHTPPTRPTLSSRRGSSKPRRKDGADQGLLSPVDGGSLSSDDDNDLDLPPSARRSPNRALSPLTPEAPYPTSGSTRPGTSGGAEGSSRVATATGAVKQLISDISQDPANAFKQIDDGFLKPHLLLDPKSNGGGPGNA